MLGIEPSDGYIIRPGVTEEEEHNRGQFWEKVIDKLWSKSSARDENVSSRKDDGVWGSAVDAMMVPLIATHRKVG